MLQAGRRSLSIRAFTHGQQGPSECVRRTLSRTTRSSSAIAISSSVNQPEDAATTSETNTSRKEDIRMATINNYVSKNLQTKYDSLLDSLDRDEANPNRTWGYYIDYLDFTRDGNLPLQIHQRVLRKCAPHPSEVRKAFALSLRTNFMGVKPHRHETRFLEVMNNMRRGGHIPDVADYEHILAHFAAVGHYIGSAQILQEIIQLGLKPRTATYGLCLQAIAYRLTLPCPKDDVARLQKQCSDLNKHILKRIQERHKVIPSVCLDLAHRIMKDTNDSETFMSILKTAYGIDINFLDRHALVSEGAPEKPIPFSTASLTTLVDFLGKAEKLSQMVSAFEVLTAPLSVGPFESRSNNFEDDDEEDFFIPSDSNPSPPPFAKPNITTYNTLIRHCCIQKSIGLASHYVKTVIKLDEASSSRLKADIFAMPLSEVPPPDLQLNIDTLRPLLGLAKRTRNNGILKWFVPAFRNIRRRKREELSFYSGLLLKQQAQLNPQFFSASTTNPQDTSDQDSPAEGAIYSVKSLSSPDSTVSFFTSSVSLPSEPASSPQASSTEQLDDNSPESDKGIIDHSPVQVPEKRFDLALHVRLLERDVAALKELDSRLGEALERLTTRTKEKLGRRVWDGKNIYLRDANARLLVGRRDWVSMVNFGGKRAVASGPVDQEATQEAV